MTIKHIVWDTFQNPGDNPYRNNSRTHLFLTGFIVLGYSLLLIIVPVGGAYIYLNHKGIELNECGGNNLRIGERLACTVFEVSSLFVLMVAILPLTTTVYFLSGIPEVSIRTVFYLLSLLVKINRD